MISKRNFLAGGAASLLATTLPQRAFSQQDVQLGSMTVTSISDGHLTLPRDFIRGDLDADLIDPILNKFGIDGPQITPECNVTLIRDEDRTILVDAGAGPEFQSSAGQLLFALEDAGVDPFDVTHVIFTHGHPDHLWGVLDDFGDLAFPNATYLIGEAEFAYWTDANTVDTIGEARAAFAVGAMRRLSLIQDRMAFFNDGEEILPGIAARATFGHTPGHMALHILNAGAGLMVLGDCIGNHHVAFEEPGWHLGADQDAEQAAQTRLKLMDQLAQEQLPVLGFHLPNGGIGRVEAAGSAYRFVNEV